MKPVIAMMAMIGLILTIGAVPAAAQQPGTGPHHPPASPPAGSPTAGMMPMEMCRQMMMGSPAMGAGEEHKMDPRLMAQMLQMRGEMMRAMGDIMVKHGQKLEGVTK
jgi:hypothetical protein